jgi:membrane protein
MIINMIVRRFVAGEDPISASFISQKIQIPVRLAREILYNLNTAGLITEINVDKPRDRLYQPAMDVNKLTISFVLRRIDMAGGEDVPVKETREYKRINEIISGFGKKVEESDLNLPVSKI